MVTMRDIALRVSLLYAGDILLIHSFVVERQLARDLSMPLLQESLRAACCCAPRSLSARSCRAPAQAYRLWDQPLPDAAGIIDRDLKPENVLLDHEGRAFVSDFGIGRDLPPEGVERRWLTTLASLIGAPAYIAAEELRGLPTDQRTDVDALGVIFYEMLTGTTPYSSATIYEVAAQALTRRIPPPSQHGVGITPPLEQAMLRALARDPPSAGPRCSVLSSASTRRCPYSPMRQLARTLCQSASLADSRRCRFRPRQPTLLDDEPLCAGRKSDDGAQSSGAAAVPFLRRRFG